MTDTAPSTLMTPMASDLFDQARKGAANVPDHWKQGRTAYGGLTAALLLAHAKTIAEDLPSLRSALINFTGPVTADPKLISAVQRQGRNVTTISSFAEVESARVALGSFSFGAPRESSVSQNCPAPDAPAPEDCEPFIPPQFAQFAPAFLTNFETRLIEGARPVSGADRGYIRNWARHVDPAARQTELGLLCLADILPPAAMPMLKAPGPVSSMSWICNFLRPPESEDGWFMVEADLTATKDGYSSQVMRIWNRAGDLVVEGMQSIVIFA